MSAQETTLRAFLEPILPLLEMDGLTDLCINRPHEVWCEGTNGWSKHEITNPRLGFNGLMGLALLAAGFTKQDINSQHPVCSSVLPNGERCQIVIPPAVPAGTVSITIRKPSQLNFSLSQLKEIGCFDNIVINANTIGDTDKELLELRDNGQWEDFFDLAVKSRKNIIISGATGSGKTTFSKALIERIPSHERIITIEDTLELDVAVPNHVRLLYSKDGQSLSKIGSKHLLESCLRMRPDRILFQDLRDETAFFYLRSVNFGHPGSITSVHADSADLAFEQLTLLVKESDGGSQIDRADIRALLLRLVDIIVQVKKFPSGRRHITEVYFDPQKQKTEGI